MAEPRDDPNSFAVVATPAGPDWKAASKAERLRYYRRVGLLAAEAKDRELARGLDRAGRRMVPIAVSTRIARRRWDYSPMGQADPDAPPLSPCSADSRSRSLLRWKAYEDRVVLFWAFDVFTRRPWGEVLDFHRKGSRRGRGKGLPKRDVIGLSPQSLASIKDAAARWWVDRARYSTAPDRVGDRHVVGPSGVVAPRRAPVADYSSGPRRLRDGVFAAIDIRGKHIDRLSRAGGGR